MWLSTHSGRTLLYSLTAYIAPAGTSKYTAVVTVRTIVLPTKSVI